MQTLYLRKNEERRVLAGHLWIFANEVDKARSPLKSFQPGEPARIASASGRFVGVGAVNPHSLICARVATRDPHEKLDRALIDKRLTEALQLRETLFDVPYYRLCFSEGDHLPGLIVDRYGDTLVAQLTTAGMERLKESVLGALRDLLDPAAVVFKNDSGGRGLEGLERYVEAGLGRMPDEVEVLESGVRFTAPLSGGQKTGWFYDQRLNRQALLPFVRGARVLDAFSYTGAQGVMAARAGAEQVICLDQSATALTGVTRNALLNGVAERVATLRGNAFDLMAAMHGEDRRFEAVSIDPPAFMKRKKDRKAGLKAYLSLNKLALDLVEDGGVLLSCSCSQHFSADDLRVTLTKAAALVGVRLQILHQGHQGPDHPVNSAMSETDYLKGYLVRVLR